jgi:seryl-tRNA synthetase
VLDPEFIRDNPEIVKHATLVKRLASAELVDAWLTARKLSTRKRYYHERLVRQSKGKPGSRGRRFRSESS